MTNLTIITPNEGEHYITPDGYVGAHMNDAGQGYEDLVAWVNDGGDYPVCGIAYTDDTKTFTFGYWDNTGDWVAVAQIERTWTGRSL